MLSLGNQHIAGAFAEPDGEQPVARRIPLELVRCDMTRNQEGCGLVQLRHSVPGMILYRSYWYRSGVNRTMTRNLHEIARSAEELVGLQPGDLVVDIGCNDGTLLDGYETSNLRYLGFDPSDVSRYALAKNYDVVRDFYSYELLRARYADQQARVITSIAMFYDLEEPRRFVADVERALADDGVWVMELHYLPTMLEMNQFDAIVHEHLEYYSLAVIERLLADAGLGVVRAECNGINGGSLRLFIRRAGRFAASERDAEVLQRLRIAEFELALDAPDPYDRFAANAERVRVELASVCRELVQAGKTIHVYGAFNEGQHDPAVRGHRPHADPLRGGPQPGQARLGDDRHQHPDRQRGAVARAGARLLPRAAVALHGRVPRARARVRAARRQVHRANAHRADRARHGERNARRPRGCL